MAEAFIYDHIRTPRGKGKAAGALHEVKPVDLVVGLLDEVLIRNPDFDPHRVDDVVLGVVTPIGDQGGDIAKTAALKAGYPETVAGVQLNRFCASGLEAVNQAASRVRSGFEDLILAGGVESMSRVPMGSSAQGQDPYGTAVRERYGVDRFDQGVGAEMVAERWGFSRARLDEYALASHEAAARAQDAGDFEAEIAPLESCAADEGIRRDTTIEKLGTLKTPFKAGGVVTAGSASQISDGAAALAVTTSRWAAAHGVRPLARVHTAVVTAADPVIMLTGPIPATEKALAKAGLTHDDIGVYEVNEAFAPVPLAWLAETGADPARLNPRGGAIALGHPLGASGARIMTTMLHHMRQKGVRYGLQTMCEGGGMANATIVELL